MLPNNQFFLASKHFSSNIPFYGIRDSSTIFDVQRLENFPKVFQYHFFPTGEDNFPRCCFGVPCPSNRIPARTHLPAEVSGERG